MSNLYQDQASSVTRQALQLGTHVYSTGGGIADAYTASTSPPLTSLSAGVTIRTKIVADSTGACTLALNGLAPAAIKTQAGGDPSSGALKAGGIYQFTYDGTNWQLT